MPATIQAKVELARRNELPSLICRLTSGWVALSDSQPLPGCCVFMADPVVRDMNALSEAERASYWSDVCRVGDALIALGADRINYETWGNVDRALHTHITPRYAHEPAELGAKTPRQAYDLEKSRRFDLEVDRAFMLELRAKLVSSGSVPANGPVA